MIEVMVALVITAIATSGLIALFMVETRASGFSRHSTEATILAQDQIERLRTSTFVGAGTAEVGINEYGQTGGIFTRDWNVVTPTTNYDEMTVTITWDEDGLGRTVTMSSRRNR